jgi:hypothetical protein
VGELMASCMRPPCEGTSTAISHSINYRQSVMHSLSRITVSHSNKSSPSSLTKGSPCPHISCSVASVQRRSGLASLKIMANAASCVTNDHNTACVTCEPECEGYTEGFQA